MQRTRAGILGKLCRSGYIGMLNNGTYVVPKDVAEKYNKLKDSTFTTMRQKVSYLCSCLRTMGTLQGIAPMSILIEMFDTNPLHMQITASEVRSIIQNLPPEFASFIVVGDKVYRKELYPDDRGLLAAQGNKKYYVPSHVEIAEMGLTGYLPNNKQLKALIRYLNAQLDVPLEHANPAGMMIQTAICGDCSMGEILEILAEEEIRAKNDKQLDKLVWYINDMWNNTRMLLNRGFTPNEIAKGIKVQQVPLAKLDNVIDFQKAKAKKVYPNDPCPCGSGKKYKHCCGKK